MKLLAFDTSTDLLSIALTREQGGQAQLWQYSGAGGPQSSGTMIPAIEGLMAQAQLRFEALDAIAFGCGPGSFTGLRTACAVAQGLGFGAGVPLLPVDSLLAVAEEARGQHAPLQTDLQLTALLDARMDELYMASYAYADGAWQQHGDFSLIKPEQLHSGSSQALAGNVFAIYGERLPSTPGLPRWPALPTATAMLRLAPALLAQGNAVAASDALPRYIRDKVAFTTQERAAGKSASSP